MVIRTLISGPLHVTDRTPDAQVWVNVDRCIEPTLRLSTLQSVTHP